MTAPYAAECGCGWLIGGAWVRVARASIAHQRLGHTVQQRWLERPKHPRPHDYKHVKETT